ncbi:MAG: hypothetical protein M1834_001596 [Cirrosporium novae-zelandiae]|nr:MAG: hypothetical protein M1834_004113 [Cirrosporium novae-zelandiae]KAI9735580.1 MAG: hypothetical protein M1834_001596 [Cirrosporium novae-zelandiae]
MSTFYLHQAQQQRQLQASSHPSMGTHHHHGPRSRRAPRPPSSQNSHRQFRGVKSMKELAVSEPPSVIAFRSRYESARSFDIDDDLEFCPGLLTEDDPPVQGY